MKVYTMMNRHEKQRDTWGLIIGKMAQIRTRVKCYQVTIWEWNEWPKCDLCMCQWSWDTYECYAMT